jgi:hypothetical protein
MQTGLGQHKTCYETVERQADRGRENDAYASGRRTSRCLAAILAVDVVGYSRLMGEDETGKGRAGSLSRPQEGRTWVQLFARLIAGDGDAFG